MIMIINFSLETFSEWKYVIRDFLLFRQNGCRFQKLNRTLEIIVNVGKKLDRKKKRGRRNMVCRWFNTATQLASFLWRRGHPPCANTTKSVRKGGDYRRWPAGMSGTPVGKTCNGSFVRTKPTGIVRSRLPWQRTTKEKEKKTVDQCGFYYAFSPTYWTYHTSKIYLNGHDQNHPSTLASAVSDVGPFGGRRNT